MTEIPSDQHITYQLQHRKCGKASCSTCRNGQGHGPYWYAYWREGSRLRSGYVGKVHPQLQGQALSSATTGEALSGSVQTDLHEQKQTAAVLRDEHAAASALRY